MRSGTSFPSASSTIACMESEYLRPSLKRWPSSTDFVSFSGFPQRGPAFHDVVERLDHPRRAFFRKLDEVRDGFLSGRRKGFRQRFACRVFSRRRLGLRLFEIRRVAAFTSGDQVFARVRGRGILTRFASSHHPRKGFDEERLKAAAVEDAPVGLDVLPVAYVESG